MAEDIVPKSQVNRSKFILVCDLNISFVYHGLNKNSFISLYIHWTKLKLYKFENNIYKHTKYK